jgi:hypothetical protein
MKERGLVISHHAVERFIERHQRGLGLRAARAMLAQIARGATVHEIEGKQEIRRTRDGILFVVEGNTMMTVLPLGAQRPSRRPRRGKR